MICALIRDDQCRNELPPERVVAMALSIERQAAAVVMNPQPPARAFLPIADHDLSAVSPSKCILGRIGHQLIGR